MTKTMCQVEKHAKVIEDDGLPKVEVFYEDEHEIENLDHSSTSESVHKIVQMVQIIDHNNNIVIEYQIDKMYPRSKSLIIPTGTVNYE